MSDITLKKIRDEVVRLAEEKPDFVYPSDNKNHPFGCVYNATDELPCCIFGQALSNLGEPVHEEYEGNNISYVLDFQYGIVLDDSDSWKLYDDLTEVQRDQDLGKTWAEAVERLKGDNNDE